MTDMPARSTQRHPDSQAAATDPGAPAPLPTPQYAGLFVEPDLPPLPVDDTD
ncbi:hypothetical protein ACIPJG_30740 [Streptomyces halstedii]|uniref:hypothetical protein n=1 Tax=Streptomyces TaxID=1883 RepID=UPI0004B3D606|nr:MULTISPECIES: hypothetical protein [Streptomyces]WSX36948.1 hypothetical protein OG291_15350 [Streptomyces halstedii]MCW8220835.1 hypothetical protein [Streptomyces griseolus]SBU94338.1 hypothetical protein YUMDRAFT_05061 [Streptomyces sp. OspMP-M45]SCD61909.1 hypothetical protein GA0115249_106364 [Streptomyces sp. PpalLS-921]SCD65115.1 hypothetical protein GA0115241_105015 [Streptomyces sp. DpondAA-D4]